VTKEIQFSLSVSITNGKFKDQFTASSSIDQAAVGQSSGVFAVTTSQADLPFGSLTTPGICILQSLETAAVTIDVGKDLSGTIEPLMTLSSNSPYAMFPVKASTSIRVQGSGSTLLRYWILAA
jgi:hypothetical protein